MLASSFSSSRSRWSMKCKRDSAAPPIWLRRVLNDATNMDTGSGNSLDEQSLMHENCFAEGRQSQHCTAFDGNRDGKQWQNPPAQGIGAEDATELYLNPLAFSSSSVYSHQSRQWPESASVLQEGGSYATIHAAVSFPSHAGRTVQSARRTRVNSPAYRPPILVACLFFCQFF